MQSTSISFFESAVGIASVVLGIISVIVTIAISYSKTKRMLEHIISKDFEGILRKDQALQLVELYLLMIKRDLT